MSHQDVNQVALFRSQMDNRRFNAESLRYLETVFFSKDVKSLMEVRSKLIEFMRTEFQVVIREIAEKNVDQKLSILDFFVRAYAIIGDVESCLAVRYEALIFRELKTPSYLWLRVSHTEWLTFAEHSIENGFYAIAGKACENALLCLQRDETADPIFKESSDKLQVAHKLKTLKDYALTSAASRSVQAQAVKYMRRKTIVKGKPHLPLCKKALSVGSILFRDGIRMRNERKLHERQNLQVTIGSHLI